MEINKKILDTIIEKSSLLFNNNFAEKRTTLCFTGQRPKSLPTNELDKKMSEKYVYIIKKLNELIIESIENGYTYFISGLAQGIDLLASELVLSLKQYYPFLVLECAIPFLNQFSEYSPSEKERYFNIIRNADFVTLVSKEHSSTVYMRRNKYMVDKSSKVLAVWNGNKGGTYNTLEYAKKKGVACQIVYF